jgi:serine/threonine-protein kinase HipA
MIKIWTDGAEAGLLDRHGARGGTFAYLPDTPAARAASVTMPVRLPSWTVPFGRPTFLACWKLRLSGAALLCSPL